jgi:hypothetical protein
MGRVVRALKHSWNIFNDAPQDLGYGGAMTMSPRASRAPARYFNDRSFVETIYNRMAVDYASIEFYHAKLNEDGVAVEVVPDSLNNCLTLEPNIDQTAHALKIDYAMTMFEQGHAVLVPVYADMDPLESASYDIEDLRVGRVVGWNARKVRVEVYDDREVDDDGEPVNGGIRKQVVFPKEHLAIQENPFFGVMNSPNGVLQRLIQQLEHLDTINAAAASGKLDLVMQLPFPTRSDSRKKQAEERRDLLRQQLMNDELGIGYIDVTEKVIQLNRPVVNNILEQIKYLADEVKNELGLTNEILNGTASRDTLNNYFDRTIEPIAQGTALELKRKFLTKTARTQRHSIEIYRDPLKIIPLDQLAEVGDKLTRAALVTANEFRPKIGLRPSSQPGANELKNPNMPMDDQIPRAEEPPTEEETDGGG